MEYRSRRMFDEFGINAGLVEELHAKNSSKTAGCGCQVAHVFRVVNRNGAPLPPASSTALRYWAVAGPVPSALSGVKNAMAMVLTCANGSFATFAALRRRDHDARTSEELVDAVAVQGRVYQLIGAYRTRRHLFARVDPLVKDPRSTPPSRAPRRRPVPELDLEKFGSPSGSRKDVRHRWHRRSARAHHARQSSWRT